MLDPVFDPLFLECSSGCRPLVGVPEAIERVERYTARGLGLGSSMPTSPDDFDDIDQRLLLTRSANGSMTGRCWP